jgi:hypothetical protein
MAPAPGEVNGSKALEEGRAVLRRARMNLHHVFGRQEAPRSRAT